ncbi:MAG: EAL domain-containing protein [Gammaproteobacteria bacterium]|nr:EAL domain-containing protein [Gammaproteobacteria bacterium]
MSTPTAMRGEGSGAAHRPIPPASVPSELGQRVRALAVAFAAAIVVAAGVGSVQYLVAGPTFHWSQLIGPAVLALIGGALAGGFLVMRRQLRHERDLYRALADLSLEFATFRRVDGRFEYVSPAVHSLTGYTQDDFYLRPELMERIIHPDDLHRWQQHSHYIMVTGRPSTMELRIITRDGQVRWIEHTCEAVKTDDGAVSGTRSVNVDVTKRKRNELHIQHLANYDSLTRLPNRRYLVRQMEGHIAEAAKARRRFAVLFVDLDRFKHINDAFGHGFGDRLLEQVARRIEQAVGDEAMVSRFGGDEFLVVTPLIGAGPEARPYAKSILDALERPFIVDMHELHLAASVGISLFPEDGRSPDELIRRADAAMYAAKREGHEALHFYVPHQAERASDFLAMENRLRRAIDQQQFLLYYQPQVRLSSGEVCGCEALVRWKGEAGEIVEAGRFIGVAEETDLIVPIGNQIVAEALNQLAAWHEQGRRLKMAINISARQLRDPNCCVPMLERLSRGTVPLSALELEVTESGLLTDLETNRRTLEQLYQRGVSIAIDDFGTGYSSLAYLRHLPVNTLKIDRAFVEQLSEDPADQAIVRAIIAMAHSLGVEVVAEGVDSEQRAVILAKMGCDIGQGYLFGRPVPAEQFPVSGQIYVPQPPPGSRSTGDLLH